MSDERLGAGNGPFATAFKEAGELTDEEINKAVEAIADAILEASQALNEKVTERSTAYFVCGMVMGAMIREGFCVRKLKAPE